MLWGHHVRRQHHIGVTVLLLILLWWVVWNEVRRSRHVLLLMLMLWVILLLLERLWRRGIEADSHVQWWLVRLRCVLVRHCVHRRLLCIDICHFQLVFFSVLY